MAFLKLTGQHRRLYAVATAVIAAGVGTAGVATQVHAGAITTPGALTAATNTEDNAGASYNGTSVGGVTVYNLPRALAGSYSGTDKNVDQGFALPTLLPGQMFVSASYTVSSDQYTYGIPTTGGHPAVDLYALTPGSGNLPTTTNGFGTTSEAGTLIQSNFLNTAAVTALNASTELTASTVTTSSSGDTALLNYLNSIYTNGTPSAAYAYLRFTPISYVASGNGGFDVYNANSSNPTTPLATITYTVTAAPEPATLGVAAIGLLAVAARRRRKLA